jgi:hypothetical protein
MRLLVEATVMCADSYWTMVPGPIAVNIPEAKLRD